MTEGTGRFPGVSLALTFIFGFCTLGTWCHKQLLYWSNAVMSLNLLVIYFCQLATSFVFPGMKCSLCMFFLTCVSGVPIARAPTPDRVAMDQIQSACTRGGVPNVGLSALKNVIPSVKPPGQTEGGSQESGYPSNGHPTLWPYKCEKTSSGKHDNKTQWERLALS